MACCLIGLFLLALLLQLATPKLKINQFGRLVDEWDRKIIIHGLNTKLDAQSMLAVSNSISSFTFASIKLAGLNTIRLAFMWEALEPKQNFYDRNYLKRISDTIAEAASEGLMVVLVSHQYLYSKSYCGQGFPAWLTPSPTFPAPLRFSNAESTNKCQEHPDYQYFFTDDLVAFQHRFFTDDSLFSLYAAMWRQVLLATSSHQNIVGLQLLNCPTSGAKVYANPFDSWGLGIANNKYLLPFYSKLARTLAQVDAARLLLFQPRINGVDGFWTLPPNVAISYRVDCADGQLTSSNCEKYASTSQVLHNKNARTLRTTNILSEFGDTPSNVKDAVVSNLSSNAAAHFLSWFYSSSKNPVASVSLVPQLLKQSYATAICGTPVSQQRLALSYELTIVPAKCLGSHGTEIYLDEQGLFKDGFIIDFGKGKCTDCRLKFIKRSVYELIVTDAWLGKQLTLKVVASISK